MNALVTLTSAAHAHWLPVSNHLVAPSAEVGHEAVSADADYDGVPDHVEQRTGTHPHEADSDEDGVPDGVEDANHDGIVDADESDPRVPGLFPGSSPHIPEPLMFDLVRGLGAKKDEVETNALVVMQSDRAGRAQFLWAPEVEWAFTDGAAIEFELPMHGRELEALKSALQITLPLTNDSFTHGVQVIGEYLIAPRQVQAALLYLAGARAGAFSTLWMAGARGTTPLSTGDHLEVLLNPSLHVDLGEEVTAGLELNLALSSLRKTHAVVVPQVHWQISRRVRVQLGAGAAIEDRAVPAAFSRFVLE